MTADCPVYRAERAAWKLHPAFNAVVPDATAFVDYVCNSQDQTFRRLRTKHNTLPDVRVRGENVYEHVTVATGAATMRCLGLANLREQHIDLAPGLTTQGVLLHEIAHLCSPVDAHHDARFAANELSLVRRWLGERPAALLLAELRKQGVPL